MSEQTDKAGPDDSSSATQTYETLPITDVIQGIRSGWASVHNITAELRRRCIEHLALEGMTTSEIVKALGISERTIRRDRAVLRSEQAISQSDSLGDEMLGEFERIAQASIGRLMRLCRGADTPPYVKLWAEDAIVRTYQRLMDTAHRMGHIADGRDRPRFGPVQEPQEPCSQEEHDLVYECMDKVAKLRQEQREAAMRAEAARPVSL